MKTDADKLRSFLKQATPIIETYGKKSLIAEIDTAITTTENSATVLFCGEFKRGKSSLVNAIIGTNLCPTDIGIATSVITTIKYGAVKKAVRYYGNLLEDANSLKSEEIEWDDIEKYTMGDVLEIDNTILVELSYPSPFLNTYELLTVVTLTAPEQTYPNSISSCQCQGIWTVRISVRCMTKGYSGVMPATSSS